MPEKPKLPLEDLEFWLFGPFNRIFFLLYELTNTFGCEAIDEVIFYEKARNLFSREVTNARLSVMKYL